VRWLHPIGGTLLSVVAASPVAAGKGVAFCAWMGDSAAHHAMPGRPGSDAARVHAPWRPLVMMMSAPCR